MNVNSDYRICTRCVIDTTDADITFDEQGICNNCSAYMEKLPVRIIPEEKRDAELAKIIERIKQDGKGNEYDCIIGLSGGTDSTYLAYKIKEFGLRPIAIHVDNGWDSELAVKNIEKTLKKLDIPLYTHVIDWEEFRDIQLSFLHASVPDMEIPTDHAILSVLYQSAVKFKTKYILSGSNYNDEGILPESWAYGHIDWKYVKGIHQRFGKMPMKTFPHTSLSKLYYYLLFKRIKTIAILNYMHFEKAKARELLKEKLDWFDYGGKHNESVYTKFIQDYILPKKFNIDKRKSHFSGPILRGQMSRAEALEKLKYPDMDEKSLQDLCDYVLKKFELSEEEFQRIMQLPVKTSNDYPSNKKLVAKLRKLLNWARKKGVAYS
jgi:N-acetyl sugar amidotransferase